MNEYERLLDEMVRRRSFSSGPAVDGLYDEDAILEELDLLWGRPTDEERTLIRNSRLAQARGVALP